MTALLTVFRAFATAGLRAEIVVLATLCVTLWALLPPTPTARRRRCLRCLRKVSRRAAAVVSFELRCSSGAPTCAGASFARGLAGTSDASRFERAARVGRAVHGARFADAIAGSGPFRIAIKRCSDGAPPPPRNQPTSSDSFKFYVQSQHVERILSKERNNSMKCTSAQYSNCNTSTSPRTEAILKLARSADNPQYPIAKNSPLHRISLLCSFWYLMSSERG